MSIFASICLTISLYWCYGPSLFGYQGRLVVFFFVFSLAYYATFLLFFMILDVFLYIAMDMIIGLVWS